MFGTPTTATSGRSPEFRKGSNPNPVEFVEDLLLLRSPKASEGEGGALGEAEALKRGNTVGVRDQVMDLVASQGLQVSRQADNLLPTPVASEGTKAPAQQDAETKSKTGQVWLSNVAKGISNAQVTLFPTLRASDGYERRNQKTMDKIAAEGGDMTMPTLARTTTNWGKFAPAITRWESLTRPAPAPTKPDGKDGNHRLSAEFTEWMMGLPEGWVTAEDIGLKRNDALKACGNGVVPQQAELALRILLQDVKI